MIQPKLRFVGFERSWSLVSIGDMASVIGGFPWSSKDYSSHGTHLVITIANVNGHRYLDDTQGNKITPDDETYILNKDDILVTLTGNVGRVSKATNSAAVLNQRVGKIVVRNKSDHEFLFQIMRNGAFEKSMIFIGQGAAQKNISNRDVLDYRINTPQSSDEKKKIADFFSTLDQMIDLSASEVTHLEQLKKGYMQRMFPKEGETVPELRFEGFDTPWEPALISERCRLLKGALLGKMDLSEDGTPCVLYGELYTVYGDNAAEIASRTQRASPRMVYSKKGDVLVPSSGETPEDISTATCVQHDGVALGGDLNVLRPNKDNGHVLALVLSYVEKRRIASLAQGKSVVHISNNELGKLSVMLPSLEEQESLSRFFQVLDSLIQTAKEELETLRTMKKGYMQRMFC